MSFYEKILLVPKSLWSKVWNHEASLLVCSLLIDSSRRHLRVYQRFWFIDVIILFMKGSIQEEDESFKLVVCHNNELPIGNRKSISYRKLYWFNHRYDIFRIPVNTGIPFRIYCYFIYIYIYISCIPISQGPYNLFIIFKIINSYLIY